MSELEFERAIRNALVIDIEKIYGLHDDCQDNSIPHTPKYLSFEKKILKDPMSYVNRISKSIWKRAIQTAAMIILTIAVIFGLMITMPPVRAFVFSVVEEYADHNEHKTFETRPDGVIGECNVGYLPEGFAMVSSSDAGLIVFSDGNSKINLIYDYAHSDTWIAVNNEDVLVQDTMIGEHHGFMYISLSGDKKNGIVWFDEVEKMQFFISSTIDIDELIKVAESVYIG